MNINIQYTQYTVLNIGYMINLITNVYVMYFSIEVHMHLYTNIWFKHIQI